jgi:hypothetical protein
MNRRLTLVLILVCATMLMGVPALAAEPDYSAWTGLLRKYYDRGKGMDYAGLKKSDYGTLKKLSDDLGKVEVGTLSKPEQLAFWLNLYNISTVKLIVDNYPTKSIRDLSTDPIVRLNVFKKPLVRQGGAMLALNDIENDRIREGFKDPRIHFAINCAARSCPPMRTEAFTGARLSEQLDDTVRQFFAGPGALRIEGGEGRFTMTTSKVLDWFEDDFKQWGGGVVAFTMKYLPADRARMIAGTKVSIDHFDYDWSLNDWRR